MKVGVYFSEAVLQRAQAELEALAADGKFSDYIEKYVAMNDHVTFVELQRRLEPYMPTQGDISAAFGDDNVFIWFDMSEQFWALIHELINDQRIHIENTNPLTYIIDGCMPAVPIAERVKAYEEEHWLPVVLRPGKHPLESDNG